MGVEVVVVEEVEEASVRAVFGRSGCGPRIR